MEPIIYKPGAYKSPGIYKGAGGIYKGRGVYNDGANSIKEGFVHIGLNDYHWIKIGSLLWTTEDLNENVGSVDYQSVFGKLYFFNSIINNDGTLKSDIANLLHSGWRIATRDDFLSLYEAVRTVFTDAVPSSWAKYLKSKTDWTFYSEEVKSLDSFGLNLKPSGSSIFGSGRGIGLFSFTATATMYNSTQIYRMNADYTNNNIWLSSKDSYYESYSIRLVKDD